MTSKGKNRTALRSDGHTWIISQGRNSTEDLSSIGEVADEGTAREYKISDIACYLLNPDPIELKKRLMGCEIHYRKPCLTRIKDKFRKIVPQKLRKSINADSLPPEVLLSSCKLKIPAMKDRELEAHFNQIYELLRSYDSVTKRLAQLNLKKIDHIIGICEDFGGNLSYLKLQGGVEEKIKYLANFISKDVGVVLRRAYIADGLFELRGFDFGSYDANNAHRLISFQKEGQSKLCVLNPENKITHRMADDQLLKYMHLLEHSIKVNPSLKHAFDLCIKGQARAVKLFFNKKLEIDYSKTHFPKVYREVFNTCNVAFNKRNLVKTSLNYLQIGVSLNYVPLSETGADKLYTHISVLHDLRALEPLKTNLPQVYSEISKSAFMSEVGRFYLLDSIEGQSYA